MKSKLILAFSIFSISLFAQIPNNQRQWFANVVLLDSTTRYEVGLLGAGKIIKDVDGNGIFTWSEPDFVDSLWLKADSICYSIGNKIYCRYFATGSLAADSIYQKGDSICYDIGANKYCFFNKTSGVDTIYRKANIDSIFYRKNNFEYAIKDSASGGNLSISIGDTIVSANSGSILFTTLGGVLSQDSSLFNWNNTDKRLIVGGEISSTSNVRTTILGSGTTSSTFGLQVHNSTGTNNALVVRDDGNIGIGALPANTVRLDLRAQSATASDIAFRVRNSANTRDNFRVNNDGSVRIEANLGTTGNAIAINATPSGEASVAIGSTSGLRGVTIGYGHTGAMGDGVCIGNANTNSSLAASIVVGKSNTSGAARILGIGNTGQRCIIIGDNNVLNNSGLGTDNRIVFGYGMTDATGGATLNNSFMFGSYATTGNKAGLVFKSNNINQLLLGYHLTDASYSSVNGTNWFGIKNGTAPDGAVDAFQQYSADIVAGNAAPHFRTENGDIIKLYQQTTAVGSATYIYNASPTIHRDDTFDGYTLSQIVKALRNLGLLQ